MLSDVSIRLPLLWFVIILCFYVHRKIFVLLFIATSGILQAQSLKIKCLENYENRTCTVENLEVSGKYESIESVSNNGIEDIDDFHVFNQQVEYLPTNIGETFPRLNSLRIQRSGLKNIDRNSFSKMNDLETLSLWNNDLESLDHDTFDDLPLLIHLDLNDNNIEKLDRRTFNKLLALITLNLDSNEIKSLDVMIFKNNKNLEHLSIQKNALKTLPITIFEKLESLKILNLDNNELEGLPDQLFKTNLQLRELTVADNNIESVGAENRDRLMNLELHNFLYNPCTKTLKQEATNEELLAILEENCKTEPPTRIKWLETEIQELRRSKREDAGFMACAEAEFFKNDENINSTRAAILSSISDLASTASSSDSSAIQDDLNSIKTTLKTVDTKADDIKQTLTNEDSKINANFKALSGLVNNESKAIVKKIDDKILKVKDKIDTKVVEVIAAIGQQMNNQDKHRETMKTDLLKEIDTKLLAKTQTVSDNVDTKVRGIDTKIDGQITALTDLKKIIDSIDSKMATLRTIESKVETLEKATKCNFYELTFDFINSVAASVDGDEKFKTLFTNVYELKDKENKEADVSINSLFKEGADKTFETNSWISKLKANCGMTVTAI